MSTTNCEIVMANGRTMYKLFNNIVLPMYTPLLTFSNNNIFYTFIDNYTYTLNILKCFTIISQTNSIYD